MRSVGGSKPEAGEGHISHGYVGHTKGAGRGPTNPNPQVTPVVRNEIVRLARQQVAQGGTVVLRGIASAMGISPAAIYHHVRGLLEIQSRVASSIDASVAESLDQISCAHGERSLDALIAGAAYVRAWALTHRREFAFAYCTHTGGDGPQTFDSEVLAWASKTLTATGVAGAPDSLHWLLLSPPVARYVGLLTLEVAGRLPVGSATVFDSYWRIFEGCETASPLGPGELMRLRRVAVRYSRACAE